LTDKTVYACFGDSITSDQVTGIGTVVAAKLGYEMLDNYACGYATCTDWHDNKGNNTTTVTLVVPPNTNTDDNVLSNQVRRLLADLTAEGEQITWEHPIDGKFSLDCSIGVGTGKGKAPNVVYIAVSTNDGNHPENAVVDDTDLVLAGTYSELTRTSLSSALRWAIETIQSACPAANIFVATPLQTCTDNEWMSYENTRQKRDIIKKVCRFCGVKIIDSFYESGFNRLATINGGGVHPNEEWKENIASYVAAGIAAGYLPAKKHE
jgi:hypothetical protein